jgi:hypothetical protein
MVEQLESVGQASWSTYNFIPIVVFKIKLLFPFFVHNLEFADQAEFAVLGIFLGQFEPICAHSLVRH